MGLNGFHYKLIFLVGTTYEGWMTFQFTFVHKGILVIMQGCTKVSEQGLQIEVID